MNLTLENKSNRLIFFSVLIIFLILGGYIHFNIIKPVLIFSLIGYTYFFWKKSEGFNLSGLSVVLSLLFAIELIAFTGSIYKPNSLLLLDKMFFWILFCFVINHSLGFPGVKDYVLIFIGVFALMLANVSIFSFINLNGILSAYGWDNAAQFKTQFSPFGLRNNDWATIAICLLPFPLIAGVLHSKIKAIVIICFIAFSLIVFSVLITFSRGAYLALFVFLLATTSLILFFKPIRLRPLIAIVAILFCTVSLLTLSIAKPFTTTVAMNKTVSQQRSTAGRLEIFKQGWCKAKENWLTGVGGYNYVLADSDCVAMEEDSGFSSFSNNLYLQILIEKGLLGLLVYSLFFIYVLISLFKSILKSQDKNEQLIDILILAGFIAYCFRELFFSSFFECNPVFIIIGVYTALSIRTAPSGKLSLQDSLGTFRKLGFIFILIIAIGLYANYLKDYRSQKTVSDTANAWIKGSPFDSSSFFEVTNRPYLRPSPYLELTGLLYGQVNHSPGFLFKDSLKFIKKNISKSLESFKTALVSNPEDGGFNFNSGFLLFAQDQTLTAISRKHFEQALKSEPNNIEFLVGYGMLCEKTGDTLRADILYEKATRLDPELLDSEFFIDLLQRRPGYANLILDKTILNLKTRIDSAYNSIFLARLARLYWSKSDLIQSKTLFEQVLNDLPDLYRPYYFLGRISEQQGDSSLALSYYRKSVFLNNLDYLAPIALGDYYYHRLSANSRLANSILRYYKDGLRNMLQHQSRHRVRSKLQYKTNTPITNDLVLKNLMPYTRTKLDFSAICIRIANVCSTMGLKEQQIYFSNLAMRDMNDLNAGDLIFKSE